MALQTTGLLGVIINTTDISRTNDPTYHQTTVNAVEDVNVKGCSVVSIPLG